MRQQHVLSLCPYFDEIINSDFLEDDLLTKKLIEYYREYIFNNGEKNNHLITKLDQAMYKYINDYRFAKELKNTLEVDEVVCSKFAYIKELMNYIITFYDEYQEVDNEVIKTTKWL